MLPERARARIKSVENKTKEKKETHDSVIVKKAKKKGRFGAI